MRFSRIVPIFRGFPLLALLALLLAGPSGAAAVSTGAEEAGATPWSATARGQVRLIAAAGPVAGKMDVALEFRLDPGWKVYWRTPGDAGYPPRPDWSKSDNLEAGPLAWPAPERFSIFDLETVGYEGHAVLPFTVRVLDPSRPARLAGSVDFLICDDVCIPHEVSLQTDLPAAGGRETVRPTPFAPLIGEAQARVPVAADGGVAPAAPGADRRGPRMIVERVALSGSPSAAVLRVSVGTDGRFTAPDLFVEGPQNILFPAPETALWQDGRQAVFTVPVPAVLAKGLEKAGDRLDGLTLTVVDDVTGLAAEYAPGPAIFQPEAGGTGGLWAILALAVLGGLILNLMPCVLPVLSLKLLKIVRQSGKARAKVRQSFLVTTAGILTAFWGLAAALAGLRAAGHAIGWGIQFQEPLFLLAMAVVVTLFACNLWGFFEITLPRPLADRLALAGAAKMGGDGGNGGPGSDGNMLGDFATGMFATLLATPCSAPFLGTALGFAFAGTAAEIFAVFTALGFGLALPYLGVALFPGLVAVLPRPGPWMGVLRRLLAVALVATAAWLLWVLSAQFPLVWAAAAALGLVGLGISLHLFHRWREIPAAGGMQKGTLVAALAAGAMVTALLLLPALVEGRDGGFRGAALAGKSAADDLWRPFDLKDIPRHVAAGQVVLVDVTADWCVTCQANKIFVLDQKEITGRLRPPSGAQVVESENAPRAIAMRADWTRKDPSIAAYLASFGRYGIPFNAVYGPAAPAGIALPELPGVEEVLAAMAAASGDAGADPGTPLRAPEMPKSLGR